MQEKQARELQFANTIDELMQKVGDTTAELVHSGVDMQAVECMRTMLPPVLTESRLTKIVYCLRKRSARVALAAERECSAYGAATIPQFNVSTAIKFIRKHGQRLASYFLVDYSVSAHL